MPSLIGNKPNQVPSNGDLGSMAFREQDQFYSSQQTMGFKNRIINGAMMIDQRNAGASVTPNSSYTIDRWAIGNSQTSKLTVQQNAGSVTLPAGFTNYLGVTSSSAYTVLSGDNFQLYQVVEGFNCADFGWGTANAQPATLSFWVRSSLTGTFGGSLATTAGSVWVLPFSYTIPSANTWTYITVPVPASSSALTNNNNTAGIFVRFGLGTGSSQSGGTSGVWTNAGNFIQPSGTVSVVGTNGATFYITGVQLEKGSTATSFDYRPYGTELALCQRYFISYGGSDASEQFGMGKVESATLSDTVMLLPVEMRTTPTLGFNAANGFKVNDSSVENPVSALSISLSGPKNVRITATTSGLTLGRATRIMANNTLTTRLTFSAEL